MNPNNLLIKILAEAVRAATPQGSLANSIASGIKSGATAIDAVTANTPEQAAHALASLLSEYAYANSQSERERAALTLGNALLMAIEAAQYAPTTIPNVQLNASVPSYALPSSPAYNPLQSPYFQHESSVFQNEYNKLMRQKEQLLEEKQRLTTEFERQREELQKMQDEQTQSLRRLREQLRKQ